jgi:hypothetical protein
MNWGWRITIVYILFVIGIMTLVLKAKSERVELVAPDYYAQEVAYGARMTAKENLKSLSTPIVLSQTGAGLDIAFPAEMRSGAEGMVKLYRPSNSDLDKSFPMLLDTAAHQVLPIEHYSKGLYMVQITWKMGDKDFYFEEPIVMN